MINRIINPYNALAFYPGKYRESKHCPVYSPLTTYPPFQVKISGLVSTYSATLFSEDEATSISINSSASSKFCDDTKSNTWITYDGTGLASTPSPGMYFIRLTVGTTEYWSHRICMEGGFDTQAFGLGINCLDDGGSPPTNYSFELSFSGTANGTTQIETSLTNRAALTWAGSTGVTLDQDDFAPFGAGNLVFYVRLTVYNGDTTYYQLYQCGFLTTNPCGTITSTLIQTGGEGLDGYNRLTFYNATDFESMGLLYQEGYQQKFYFKSHPAFPTPVEEFNFVENGQGAQVFESASVFETVTFDAYPVPDYLRTVMAAVRAHDTVSLFSAQDGKSITPENLTIEPRVEDGDICTILRMNYEDHRAFINACGDNITSGVC